MLAVYGREIVRQAHLYMRITKYNHACLLVEDNGNNTLIDPGAFSEDVLDVNKLPKIDYLLITHEHMDHLSIPLVKQIVATFPDVKIVTTPEIVQQLAKENIQATDTGDDYIKVESVPHERNWGFPPPQNILVTLGEKLAHPGDSHTFSTHAEILALPITAPWGSTTAAVDVALKLKPKVIIPIHDFMLKDESRRLLYSWVKPFLQDKGIDFKAIETAEPVEI